MITKKTSDNGVLLCKANITETRIVIFDGKKKSLFERNFFESPTKKILLPTKARASNRLIIAISKLCNFFICSP